MGEVDGERCVLIGGENFDQPKIGEQQALLRAISAFSFDEHIARLDIAMDQATIMCVLERVQYLPDQAYCFSRRDDALPVQAIFERAASHARHYKIGYASLFAIVIDRKDVRVIKLGQYTCFALETAQEFLRFADLGSEDFESNLALQVDIFGKKYSGGPSIAKSVYDTNNVPERARQSLPGASRF